MSFRMVVKLVDLDRQFLLKIDFKISKISIFSTPKKSKFFPQNLTPQTPYQGQFWPLNFFKLFSGPKTPWKVLKIDIFKVGPSKICFDHISPILAARRLKLFLNDSIPALIGGLGWGVSKIKSLTIKNGQPHWPYLRDKKFFSAEIQQGENIARDLPGC